MHAYRHLSDSLATPSLALDERSAFALRLYRRAVGLFARSSSEAWCLREPWDAVEVTTGRTVEGLGPESFRVMLRLAPGEETWDPSFFDRIYPADEYKIRGVRNRHTVMGLGAPLIAERDQVPGERSYLDFYPPEGIVYPVTLVIRFGSEAEGRVEANAGFYDVLGVSETTISGDSTDPVVRLASDFTAPLGLLWSRSKLQAMGHDGMLNVRGQLHRVGLYMLEPYRPDKIPVLMIHGLRSSPLTWRDAFNDLRGDQRIRENYQFWFFMYPTGLPVPRSASYLRADLAQLRSLVDPASEHQNLSRMVVVGHSMGGLLTKSLITDPGDLLWTGSHDIAFEELQISQASLSHLREVFFYKPDAGVARAVFISTPHGGSVMADSFLGRLGKRLVDLPDDMRRVGRELKHQRGALGAALRRTRFGVPTSIHNLSPESPFLNAYADMPFVDVPRHSIVGDRGDSTATRGTKPPEQTSDGVVAYTSASLPGVESELIVPAPHNSHEHPLAIEELRRILYLHLDEVGPVSD